MAAAAVALLFAGSASAQKLDANGRCHDASGKFAKAEVCGGTSKAAPAKTASATTATTKTASAKPAKSATPAASAATSASATAKAAPTKCKNAKGKYAKCGSPGATPA